MANPNPRQEFLKPLNTRTKKAQRKIQSMGGKASCDKIRKTKELIKVSNYLHEFIDSQQEDVRKSLKEIVAKGGSPLIALIKVILEATEGSTVHNTGLQTITIANAEQVKKIISKLDV
jgi:arsenate reductase-like glutaredoxin family protein